jgi:hypothetical protein
VGGGKQKMMLEVMGPLMLCGILISLTLPVMLRLMRATAEHREQKEMDKWIEKEERQMRRKYGI